MTPLVATSSKRSGYLLQTVVVRLICLGLVFLFPFLSNGSILQGTHGDTQRYPRTMLTFRI